MSTSSDRNVGLLSGTDSDSYASVDGDRGDGVINKLRYRSPHLVLPLLITTAVSLLLVLGMLGWYATRESTSSPALERRPLYDYVGMEAANTHLNGLQGAADKGNGTRQTGTPGYAESVNYVMSVVGNLTTMRARRQPWTHNGRSGVNVIADTITGDPANTIIMGGHLDSFGGPGLNDDGTGSTAVMLLAQAVNEAILSGDLVLTNRIRFHWYDAEEAGLRGSRAAVALGVNATDVGERLRDWVCQMQADMVGAPNYILGIVDSVYLGNTTQAVPNSTLAGSHVLARMFREQFVSLGYPFRNITTYHQQSDQWSYWVQGIPAAFGITGVYEIHTADDVRDFGGLIGVRADAQIHTAADNVLNVNLLAQVKMTRAYAGVLQQLAVDGNVRSTLHVTHDQVADVKLAPSVDEHWEAWVAEKAAQGRAGPEDDFHAWFPLAREWTAGK